MVSEAIAKDWIWVRSRNRKVSTLYRVLIGHAVQTWCSTHEYSFYGEDRSRYPQSRNSTPASHMVATYSAEILNTVQTKEPRWNFSNRSHGSGKENVLKWNAPSNPRNRGWPKEKKEKEKRSGRSTADAPIPLGPQTRSGRIHFLFIIASLVDSIDPKLGHYIINKVI